MAGFKPTRQPLPAELVTCVHLAGDAVTLGKGDPVKLANGSVSVNNGPVKQAVARAASGDRVFGVVVGVDQLNIASSSLERTHCPASTAAYISVIPVATLNEYEIKEDAVGGSVATTDVGKNALFIAANCSTRTGQSGYLLDSSSAATTNTHDLCIRGFSPNVGNVPGSTATLVVSFNKVAGVDQATGV